MAPLDTVLEFIVRASTGTPLSPWRSQALVNAPRKILHSTSKKLYIHTVTVVLYMIMFTTEFTQDQPCFTVALCDYPGLPDTERQRAEARYARTLARQLGGEPEVANALRTIEQLEDAPPEEITEEAKSIYQRWMKAARAAAEAGMQGLGGEEGCYFEVRRH